MDIADRKGGMGFPCGSKTLLDAYMKLHRAYSEPTTATRTHGFRLFDFGQPKNLTKEVACLGLASFRGCDLQMVNVGYECSRRDSRSLRAVRSPHQFAVPTIASIRSNSSATF
jgi:hypothetical protein